MTTPCFEGYVVIFSGNRKKINGLMYLRSSFRPNKYISVVYMIIFFLTICVNWQRMLDSLFLCRIRHLKSPVRYRLYRTGLLVFLSTLRYPDSEQFLREPE